MRPLFLLLTWCCLAGCSVPANQSPPALAMYPKPLPVANGPDSKPNDGSLFREQEDLYADATAQKVGDTLTVIIQERHSVKEDGDVNLEKKAQTNLSAKTEPSSLMAQLPFLADSFKLQGSRDSKTEGKVKYYNTSSLNDRLTVVVTEVRPDGLLVVWGKRQISFTSEVKTMALTGLVNTKDIQPDNSILSDRIALAAIHMDGSGAWSATTEPSLAAKTFRWVLDLVWPF